MTQKEWVELVGTESENASEEEVTQHLESEFARRAPSSEAGSTMWNLQESLMEASTPSDSSPRSNIWGMLRWAAQIGMVLSSLLLLRSMAKYVIPSKAQKIVEYDI